MNSEGDFLNDPNLRIGNQNDFTIYLNYQTPGGSIISGIYIACAHSNSGTYVQTKTELTISPSCEAMSSITFADVELSYDADGSPHETIWYQTSFGYT